MGAEDRHPVATGLLALVGVGLAVGLVLGLATMVGTRVVGVDGEAATSTATAAESLYLPSPTDTGGPSGPLITLAPEPGQQGSQDSQQEQSEEPSPTRKADKDISLSAGQTSVSAMQQIDLTGVYPGGEGAILQVQRFTGDSWEDFPVTVSVSNETFSTYVQTGQTGKNRFRVVDTDTGTASAAVSVTVG